MFECLHVVSECLYVVSEPASYTAAVLASVQKLRGLSNNQWDGSHSIELQLVFVCLFVCMNYNEVSDFVKCREFLVLLNFVLDSSRTFPAWCRLISIVLLGIHIHLLKLTAPYHDVFQS